jgi:hypothetical protein
MDGDVHRVHFGRPILQQAIGKASRGAARIEADLSLGANVKVRERAFELESTAAGIAEHLAGDFDARVIGYAGAGLVDPLACDLHLSRHDECLRALARGREAAFDQEHVNARFFRLRAIHGFAIHGFAA